MNVSNFVKRCLCSDTTERKIHHKVTCSDNKDNRQLERLVQVNRRDALSDIKSAFNKHRNKSV